MLYFLRSLQLLISYVNSLQFLQNTIPLVNTKDPTIQNVFQITLFRITPNIYTYADIHKINTPYICVNIISVAVLSIQLEPTYEEERIDPSLLFVSTTNVTDLFFLFS